MRLVVIVALVAASAAFWYSERPVPVRSLPPPPAGASPLVRGAIHVHSSRSDGSGDIESIAAAAERAGLDFVILTDHGDATRTPDAARYVGRVLCIDAVEISTEHGHLVALGLPQAPYPLAGEARDAVEDIERLGGFAIAAHPGSQKADLQWRDRTPIGGLEWLNGDSEWRDESFGTLAALLVMYPLHRTSALVSLLDRPVAVLERWDELTTQNRVVAIAGTDAHARVGLRSIGEPYEGGSSFHLPSYENTFRMFSNVLSSTSLSGDAATDAQAVLAAIQAGHVHTVVDGLAGPAALSFTATSGGSTVSAGDALPVTGPVTLRADVQATDDARIALFKDGTVLDTWTGPRFERTVDEAAAVYRIEVSLPGSPGQPPVPWILSNPIYVGRSATPVATGSTPPALPRPSQFAIKYEDGPATGWTVEHSPASLGALDEVKTVTGRQLSLRYALGGSTSSSAYAAFVMPAGADLQAYDRLMFTGRADHPMRVSVQLRGSAGVAEERWHRSVYLDPSERVVTVLFDDMLPRGPAATIRPSLAGVNSVLFVVDTVNTALGGNGTFWIDDLRYAR